jgi:TPP-dependent pyruvate/acetoin dehydrogenase alpha subunit
MKNKEIEILLFSTMLRIRMIESAIADKYSEQEMRCPVHLSIGQEAPAAAFAHAVQQKDFAVSTHRGHAHFLAKGGSLDSMIAEIYGKSTGCSQGRGGSMHLADKSIGFMGTSAIVGNSIPIGVGLGLFLQIQKIKQASCIFLGDGAIEEGVFYESANFAVLKKLPVIFFCENNKYSVYSPLEVRQPVGRSISQMVKGIGLNGIEVDGNDVIECFTATKQALEKARSGEGPQFLEFHTFRHLEHCGPNNDDHLSYRKPGELDLWLERDPITLFTKSLLQRNLLSTEDIEKIKNQIETEIEGAFQAAQNAPFPDAESFKFDVYAK